jgi:hypothetical protein
MTRDAFANERIDGIVEQFHELSYVRCFAWPTPTVVQQGGSEHGIPSDVRLVHVAVPHRRISRKLCRFPGVRRLCASRAPGKVGP